MSTDYGSCAQLRVQPDFTKDPDETLDFPINWKPELNGDMITMSQFILPDGLNLVSQSNTTNTSTVFVSGGTSGLIYRITNRITTIGGRTRDRTINILVTDL